MNGLVQERQRPSLRLSRVRRWRLLGRRCPFKPITKDIEGVSVVQTVQLRSFVQERQVSICSYPWLTLAEIVFGSGQS